MPSSPDPAMQLLASPTEDQIARCAQALCRFVFPGALVPRLDMARAVLEAVANPEAELPERRTVDVHGGAQATLDYVLACIKGDRFKDEMGTTAEWYVAYSLGQAAHLYHCEGYGELAAERNRLRAALDRIIAEPSTRRVDHEEGVSVVADGHKRVVAIAKEALTDAE